jgi:hypothetical protein
MSDLFWDQLLQFVEEGRVVPIVGQDLLTVDLDGRQGLLYSFLAERLAAYLDVSAEGLPSVGALHEVAWRYLAQGGELEDVYPALKSTMPPRDKLAVPEPLRQLAAIRPLKLFVSTTFDSLLEQALNEVRFGGQPRTRVYAYSPAAVQDLEAPLDALDRPVVFHLFGRLSAVPDYVVTEEDTLELVHSLQSESRRPNLLFDELNRRQILLLGSSFSDWLARFFLRMAKRERLWLARGKTDVVADSKLRDDRSYVRFLQRFSSRTKVFQGGGGVEFVAELHERWTARHPPEAAAVPVEATAAAVTAAAGSLAMEPGAVFLSYASEDRPIVEALKEALESAGVDVWFDREALQAGDDYEAKIKRNIESCSLFVPVISRSTLTSRRRFFRIEWDHAQRIAVQVPPSMRFIVPVVVDDTPPTEQAVPEKFRALHWQRLVEGRPDAEFLALMRQLYRDYQRTVDGAS